VAKDSVPAAVANAKQARRDHFAAEKRAWNAPKFIGACGRTVFHWGEREQSTAEMTTTPDAIRFESA